MSQPDPISELKRKAQITKDSRFQAHLRLERRSYFSPYLTALLSLYVIAISFYPTIIALCPRETNILLASTIVLSVFIIILSLYESSRNFYHKGKVLHENAVKLGSVINGLDVLRPDDTGFSQKLKELTDKYDNALIDCPENHDNVDYHRVILLKYWLFEKHYPSCASSRWLYRRWLYLRVFVSEYAWMILPLSTVISVSVVLVMLAAGSFSYLCKS